MHYVTVGLIGCKPVIVFCLSRRDTTDYPYLQHCSPGFADLADLELVSEGAHLPAHSQYVAFHSHFVQRLIHDMGPISWKEPLIIDSALKGHCRAAINMLLAAVYQQGVVHISTAQEAWQMYKLVDHLDCPGMLQQCQEYINSSSGAELLTSPAAALEWIIAAHELGWEGLRQQCVDSITKNYHTIKADARMMQLPIELSMMVMDKMVEQHSKFESDIMQQVRTVMLTRSGRATCLTDYHHPIRSVYKFFCEKIECPGHEVKVAMASNTTSLQSWNTSIEGSCKCSEDHVQSTVQGGSDVPYTPDRDVRALLPSSLQDILKAGCDYGTLQ